MKTVYLSRWLVPASIALALSIPVLAQSTNDLVNNLEIAMRKEIGQKPIRADSPKDGRGTSDPRSTWLSQLRSAIARPEGSHLSETFNQILISFDSPEVRSNVEKLQTALATEQESKNKAFVEKLTGILEETRQAIPKARVPADLDDVIRNLNLALERRDSTSLEQVRKLAEQVQGARQFATSWQDYLAHAAAGRTDLAAQSLQNASNLNNPNLLPRSEILARLEPFKQKPKEIDVQAELRSIMERTKTLDDVPGAIAAVLKIRQASKNPDQWNNAAFLLYGELGRIQTCYEDFRAGVPTILQVRHDTGDGADRVDAAELVTPLKAQLLRMILPRFLGVSEKPETDEALDKYVDRMLQLALERCEPRLIFRVYRVRNIINGVREFPQLSPGIDALLAARNQEDAGQFLPAVISYQRALRIGGELVPAKSVGARLEAIKAAHPAEYEAGLKAFLAKPDLGPPSVSNEAPTFTLRIPAADVVAR